MVSSRNIILAGLGAVILAVIASRGLFSRNGAITQDEIITPEIIITPTEPEPIVINPQIQILKDAIAGVQGFIKQTFRAPKRPSNCGGPGQFSCGKINFSPQPRGSRFSIDPFTGTRIALPVGARGSAVTERFFGGAQQLLSNQARVTQGLALSTRARGILTDLQNQLTILETKSV